MLLQVTLADLRSICDKCGYLSICETLPPLKEKFVPAGAGKGGKGFGKGSFGKGGGKGGKGDAAPVKDVRNCISQAINLRKPSSD